MRRPTRLGLVTIAALLVVFGAYTAYWFVVAGQTENGVIAWARSARADKIDASWQKIRLTGFPLAFRVELETATLRDAAVAPPLEFRIPTLSAAARPWDFANWWLSARQGFSGDVAGAGQRLPLKLAAQIAAGVVSIEPRGGWRLWLRLQDTTLEAAERVSISSADAWIILPPTPPQGHSDPNLALAVNAREVRLPAAIGPLGNTIDELAFGVTVKGAIPNGKLAQAAAAWRDAGGTIELDNLRLKWRELGATASGTIALDQELQPIGGFSGAIQGYDQILTAFVQNGRLRATDAGLARLALAVLAKAGPDGRPEIATAFTIQNGQMFLGPAKLGKAPRLTWE